MNNKRPHPMIVTTDEQQERANNRTKEDIARDAVQFWHERDEARERVAELERQLAAAQLALKASADTIEVQRKANDALKAELRELIDTVWAASGAEATHDLERDNASWNKMRDAQNALDALCNRLAALVQVDVVLARADEEEK